MEFGVDTLDDCTHWNRLYAALPNMGRVSYFSPDYYRAYQMVEPGEAVCFWAVKDDNNFLFYPSRKRSINELGYELNQSYYDLCGAYGYNGPAGQAEDPAFLNEFNNQVIETLKASQVVTEFVRYCPLTGNRQFHLYTDQTAVLDNVFVDISQGLDKVWDLSFEYRVRKTVRKGVSYGLNTLILRGLEISEQQLAVFWDIYSKTMDRNGADGFYYFNRGFFSELTKLLRERLIIALTYLCEKVLSCEMLLCDGELAYGFLGGTLSDYYQYKANTFQRWELIKYLHAIGVKRYSMGGGASRGDGIYKFKLSFAQNCSNPFYVGTKIHRPQIYSRIMSIWKSRYPEAAEVNSGKIQGYRIRGS